MPKSKRERIVTLAKVGKRTKQSKGELIEKIRDAVDLHTHAYVLSFSNCRNHLFNSVRIHWRSSSFFRGKNKVMQVALGRNESNEHREHLHLLSQRLVGETILFITNSPPEEVIKYFDGVSEPDFARTGSPATEDFDLKEGVLEHMSFSMEPRLKALGLPVKLNNRKIEITHDVNVCRKGQTLTADQCNILKAFERKTTVMTAKVLAYWTSDKYTSLVEPEKKKTLEEELQELANMDD